MAFKLNFERKKMDDKYRTAFTTSVLTYVSTAQDIKNDPLGLAKLPLNGSLVTGKELSLRLGRKMEGDDDSLWWVEIGTQGEMKNPRKIAPDLTDFRSKLSVQLKKWGKDNAIKKLMVVRAANAGVVAAITTIVVVAVVVSVASGGVAAPQAIQYGTRASMSLGKWALSGGPEKMYNQFSPAAQEMAATAAKGGSLADMAKSSDKKVPASVKPELGKLAKQSTQTTEQDAGLAWNPTVVGVGIGLAGIALVAGIAVVTSRT